MRRTAAAVSYTHLDVYKRQGLYKAACAARVDGEACDLRTPLEKDCSLEILTFEDKDGKHAFWHTAAHVMAQAIQHLSLIHIWFPSRHRRDRQYYRSRCP